MDVDAIYFLKVFFTASLASYVFAKVALFTEKEGFRMVAGVLSLLSLAGIGTMLVAVVGIIWTAL